MTCLRQLWARLPRPLFLNTVPPTSNVSRSMNSEGQKWLWPADRTAAIYDAFDKQNTRKAAICMIFSTSKLLQPSQVKRSLEILQRRQPNLRTCLQPRGRILWHVQKTNPAINFQVLEPQDDLGSLCEHVLGKPFSFSDPVQWRAGLAYRGSHQNDTPFPHQYALVLHIHHGHCDGYDVIKSLVWFSDILDDILSGRPINETPLCTYRENDDIESLMEQVKIRLLEDPQKIDLIRRALPSADRTPLLMKISGKPQIPEASTGYVNRTFIPQVMNKFQEKAKAAGISFNSSIIAAINTALVELATEAGLSQDTYEITFGHIISLRNYLEKSATHRSGLYGKRHIHSSTLSKNTRDNFWEYATQLHQELRSAIKTRLALQQDVVSTMDNPEMTPDEVVANTCPTLYDYSLSNMSKPISAGVNKLAESFSERWAATTILTATPAPDLSQLLVALTSFHTNDLRYMVLLCSANTTRTVFDMVSGHNLESRRVRWLVVGEDPDLLDSLLYILREGSMTATTGIFKTIYKSVDPLRSFFPFDTDAMKGVIDKNTAFINGLVGSEIYAMKHGRHLYHLARNTFHPQPYGIACPPGAPYTPVLNLMLGRMVQAGLVDKWHRDEVTNFKLKQSAGQERQQDQGEKTDVRGDRMLVRPLSLDHLQGAFYILGCFAMLAAVFLFIEVLTHLTT
ncbi:hypothetical protein Pcinc_030056 [Petrolisthes cinctipes]|uniref:Uncharacterized protein n=1 Tax=Petrolisthes cinctipes TaxID=88211 RepID=A0AAE1EZN3_PETCI|nr:hypothetical protein Pcinc_030056 [Petrolisthes cinctipes]